MQKIASALYFVMVIIFISCSKNDLPKPITKQQKIVRDTVRVIDNEQLGTRTFQYPNGKIVTIQIPKDTNNMKVVAGAGIDTTARSQMGEGINLNRIGSVGISETIKFNNLFFDPDPEVDGLGFPPIQVLFIAGLVYNDEVPTVIDEVEYARVELTPRSMYYEDPLTGDTRSAGVANQVYGIMSSLPNSSVQILYHYIVTVVYIINDFPSYRTYLFDKVQTFP
ncbi:hypothetical protein SAMN05660909_03776 [Chitinophaga terrae (ex Kim and Jung 2007)]|uniref:Uncharacterized protein n=1 Tax=Chitinophaga terrae (ex Kim and Jung 2007) TaxID=408074 RepID=A0A1H4EK91_9BACT|nr:hypothetical protein [Chitinophaga terrae (ex Kim and Jung 2007)]MDQ0107531.1 hypothetical protein [Chitinophaga terrae (ex Kim and Jung 2007)]GEP91683.1 hypothetical protein CTE07_33280 [Chitinophaga terrae (ex Kim and Jung 2007)]SEA85461.1 hypothetical protein SAMN05660909_03776 [Chitinophaga terrae (ex Kim and Jung 2007)]